MSSLQVRIERLAPMRVASFRCFGETPERDAWARLRAWAEPQGLLEDVEQHPVFGFNNPNPSRDRKEYGYEFWIRIDPESEPEPGIEVKDFEGGLFAVATCKLLGDPAGTVPAVWQKLFDWAGANGYRWRDVHELERPVDPRAPEAELVLDLCLPVQDREPE